MRRWFVTGARKGVGKTYLAKRLCAVLPSSAYAKYGHGKPKRGKSPNFFTREEDLQAFIAKCEGSYKNVVIETNTLGKKEKRDINIFLEARETTPDLRFDTEELRDNADIRVGGGESRLEWQAVLEARLDDHDLIDAISDILTEQQRRLSSRALSVRSKVWFVNAEEDHVFGPGLARLLVEVEHLGSVEVAAERVDMSYEHARDTIERAEKQFGQKLVHAAQAGGSTLTAKGKQLMALYLHLSEKATACVDEAFANALNKERDEGEELP